MAIRAGSWGTPEFGITERISDFFGQSRNSQGGSNLLGGSKAYEAPAQAQPTQQYSSPIGPTQPSVLGASTTSGSSGSSGSTRSRASSTPVAQSSPVQQTNDIPQPQGVSEQELNSIYNPSYDYLNQAESQLRSDLPTYQQEAEKQFQSSSTLLGNKKAAALNQLGEQSTAATQRNENAIAASRRLYAELQRANQQRFGGASSAGQAASELQGMELQRNRGALQQDFSNTQRQIENQRLSVENDYQGGLQQLETQKQASINQINREFQNKLLEINRQRGELSSAKAQARLQALQDLRNQVFQIQVQNYQMKQQLDAQRAAAELQLEMNARQFGNYANAGAAAATGFDQRNSGPATSQYGMNGGTVSQAQPALIGQISNTGEDPALTGQIMPQVRTSDANQDLFRA